MRMVHWFWIVVVLWSRVPLQAQNAGPPVWANLRPMPLARQEISSAALDGWIYVIAGFNGDGGSTSDVQVLDLQENRWSLAKPLPIINNHNGAAAAGGRLYTFGGVSNRAFVYNPSYSGYPPSPDGDSWTEVAPMRFEHGNTAAVGVIDNRIYVAGGTGSGMIGNELEVYDPVANTWTVLAPMAVPRNHRD